MYEVTISNNGILSKINVNANDVNTVNKIVTNMYGTGKVQIINIRRV